MRVRSTVRLAPALLAAVLAVGGDPAPARGAPAEIVLDRDDVDVTSDVVVRPGRYRVKDANGDGVLRVRADGVTVTLAGVTLDGSAAGQTPDTFEGVGVSVVGKSRVTVRGGALRGFRVGVRGEDAAGITVRGVDVGGQRAMRLRSTPQREDASDWLWPHENDAGEWEKTYGGGISLTRCAKAVVSDCRARAGQNGLLLTRCDEATVLQNDFSFLSGWGIALYRSSRCNVQRNRCDFCVRGYSHGVYARGQDSAGILVFEQCSDNVFATNSATHSGDGFFLYAGHETLKETGKGGCNRNRVVQNDFSHAVANGIEATFSEGNEFSGNRLDDCEHGVWAGYSSKTAVRGNHVVRCANGVSIEHGRENAIEGNVFQDCGVGVALWWDADEDLLASAFGKANDTASARNTVTGNAFTGGGTALRLVEDRDARVSLNAVAGAAVGLEARGPTVLASFERNHVRAAVSVRCETEDPLALGRNLWEPWKVEGKQRVTVEPALDAPPPIVPPVDPWREPRAAAVSGAPFLPAGFPRGREQIVVGEWGPLDPRVPALFPSAQSAAGTASVRVLGAGTEFRVSSVGPGFVAEPAAGKAPATIRVARAKGGEGTSVAPFELKVRVGDKDLVAAGTILSATWSVRWFAWTKDPREDPEAWKALVSAAPVDTATAAGLDYAWGGGAPTKKTPADRFGTVAETTLTLPAGTWRLRTVSDDGIRVFVDGNLEIDDWTWHAPKEVSKDLTLAAGPHAIRVEHFEIDGNAALTVTLELAK
jgi:nitrous oxidase accessory protein NosD